MARFSGLIGYSSQIEVRPGIYKEQYVERSYKGEITQNRPRWDAGSGLNDDYTINNEISVIADAFAYHNFSVMRYVVWMDQAFEISSATIDTERHRIRISLGGVFNGERPTESSGEPSDNSGRDIGV